ncbi:PTS system protein [Salmonella sp. NCTC 11881]|nr:PTS system protein [Salmonella sp. NCTC 11881]
MTTTQPLPHILLLTHGGWGQPLCNSLRMVTGEIKGVTEIALMPVDTLGEFYQRVEAVVKTLPEGSLILTDFCRRHNVQRRGAAKRRLSGGGDCRTECVATAGGAGQARTRDANRLRGRVS